MGNNKIKLGVTTTAKDHRNNIVSRDIAINVGGRNVGNIVLNLSDKSVEEKVLNLLSLLEK